MFSVCFHHCTAHEHSAIIQPKTRSCRCRTGHWARTTAGVPALRMVGGKPRRSGSGNSVASIHCPARQLHRGRAEARPSPWRAQRGGASARPCGRKLPGSDRKARPALDGEDAVGAEGRCGGFGGGGGAGGDAGAFGFEAVGEGGGEGGELVEGVGEFRRDERRARELREGRDEAGVRVAPDRRQAALEHPEGEVQQVADELAARGVGQVVRDEGGEDEPVAFRAVGDAGERVAERREAGDVVEAGKELLLAGGIRLFEDGLELVDGRQDLGDVGIVLEAEGERELHGLGLLDLALPVKPGIVLGLEGPGEAAEGLRAEEVREGVAGEELRADLAVGEGDAVDVPADLDLARGGRVGFGRLEMRLEGNPGGRAARGPPVQDGDREAPCGRAETRDE